MEKKKVNFKVGLRSLPPEQTHTDNVLKMLLNDD